MNSDSNNSHRTHYNSVQSFASGIPLSSQTTITHINNGHSSLNNFHPSSLLQSNNQPIQTIQNNATQNIPPLPPPQNSNKFIGTSSLSRSNTLTQGNNYFFFLITVFIFTFYFKFLQFLLFL